jgi:hypothetical protein
MRELLEESKDRGPTQMPALFHGYQKQNKLQAARWSSALRRFFGVATA